MSKILDIRTRLGLSRRELAIKADMSESHIVKLERGERPITYNMAVKLAPALGVKPSEIMPAIEGVMSSSLKPLSTNINASVENIKNKPKDVPVKGTASGSQPGYFLLDDNIIDYVRRPTGIENRADVFALYVVGESMEPRYFSGDLIYIDPHRPAKVGDFVIVQCVIDGESTVVVKRLMKRNSEKIILEQYNPEQVIEIKMETVEFVYRIFDLHELIGI